jgi:hypothetical protein
MSSTRKRTTANTTTFEYDQKHARTKRARDDASKRMSDATTLEDIKKLKTDVILLTGQQVKHQGIMRQSIVRHKMKNSVKPTAEIEEEREQQMKYTGLITPFYISNADFNDIKKIKKYKINSRNFTYDGLTFSSSVFILEEVKDEI